jgi:ABC-type transport system involved in multi-copper enzyme maturation permease subunit
VLVLGPIFLRELRTVPRRGGHYATRAAYLGALWVIAVTAWLATLGWTRSATLGETARFGLFLFQLLTYVQLGLFLFFSALTCASAVAKEKDRRTFVLLLMTDLRNHEIVLGKMLGSLLPIVVLQLATVPLLVLLLLLGGIGPSQVIQAIVVVLATSLAAGSLGVLVALWRERTFQSLALTVLFVVLYLLVVQALGVLAGLPGQWLDPFLALQSAHQAIPSGEGLPPAYIFSLFMFGFSVLLNLFGMARLRVWNPSGEPIIQRERPEDAVDREREVATVGKAAEPARASIHAAPGAVRHVGQNPILWREIYTRAYGRRPLLVKIAYFVVLALVCAWALNLVLPTSVRLGGLPEASASPRAGDDEPVETSFLGIVRTRTGPRTVETAILGLVTLTTAREAVALPFAAAYGLLPVVVLSLLLVTAQATTAITSERDVGALDLLLVTDLSPREFIFGKLLGILYNSKEYLLPPLLLAGVYAACGSLATPPPDSPELSGAMNATALLCILLAEAVLLAFACVLGVHVALRNQNSQVAIIHALSTIFFLSVGTLVCIALIVINRQFEYQWGSFLFFLIAGVGGLWYVLSGDRPSAALTWAAWVCPLAVLYAVMNVLVGKPGSPETADPLIPALVITGAFGFTIAAMLIPLLSEFDVAMGRTSGGAD